MTPTPPAALLIACTYERSPYPTLEWAAADVVAIARALVRHCGFQRVIVLHRRPHPFFTEGELGTRDVVLDFARQLVAKTTEPTPDRGFNIGDLLGIADRNPATLQAVEVADLKLLLSGEPTPEEFDSIESLVVAVLNRWLGSHPDDAPPPGERELLDRREQIAAVFPQLGPVHPPEAPLSEGVIEFRGVPTPDAIQRALLDLDSDPDSGQPIPMLFTAVCGHGIHHRGRNCLLLPDSNLRFLELTTQPIEHLVRWSGSHCLFIDACQVPVDPKTFPSGRNHHRSRRRAAAPPGIGSRDHGGQRHKPPEPSNWSFPTPPAPSEGAVALLHTCWPGKPALEFSRWRHGIGTRCFLEALRNSAWRTESDPDLPNPSVRILAFEEIARQVCRDVQQASWTLALASSDPAFFQAPFLHRAGSAESLLLARTGIPPAPTSEDPRLWIHPPRLRDIHASRRFRNTLGIPFVHLRHGKSLIACWPVRNADFARFRAEQPGPAPSPSPGLPDPHWPCTQVSFQDAVAFCRWLTQFEVESGLLPPHGFRYDLPTDAEWDCCVGLCPQSLPPHQIHLPRQSPWRDKVKPVGFCYDASHPIPVQEAASLAALSVNAIPGVLGLAGNVWEMTSTPFEPNSTTRITVRGQSFRTPAAEADLCVREACFTDQARQDVGFRLVLRWGE